MATLISGFLILFCLPFSYQNWYLYWRPNPYPIGETNISLQCRYYDYVFNSTFEFRQNKDHEWLTVGYVNKSGKYRIQEDSEQTSVSFLSFSGYLYSYYVYMGAYVTVHSDSCIVDEELFPSYRCRVYNGSTITSPERSILSLKDTSNTKKQRQGKRYLQRICETAIAEDMKLKCCPSLCMEKFTFSFVCEARRVFWEMATMQQNAKIEEHRLQRNSFTECKECAMLRQLKSQRLSKEQLLVVEKQKKAHLLVARIAREKYYKHAKKAEENKKKYLSIIIDNMDQSKTSLPRFHTYHKGDANLTRIHHHVTGVLAHGQKKSYTFTWTDKFRPDTNVTINCLLHVLEDLSEDRALPPVLYLQADNSAKDNKNFILIGFLANLVQRKIFRKIKLSFLMVGHTHEDVDQMFSRISVHLTGKSIPTLPVLQSLMRDAYHPTPMVQHLDGLWDYRKLGMSSPVTLQGHSGPHVFRIKTIGEGVQLAYKQWPYQSAAYKVIDITPLAAAFARDPEEVMEINPKGKSSLDSMEGDLRKWREGGKLTGADVNWWRTHIQREGGLAAPSAPLASSFRHFLEPPNEDSLAYPELEALRAHIDTLSNEANVRVAKKKS